MADTGHEHPTTVEYAERLAERTGGPHVEHIHVAFRAA
jgi:3'-phosphoadenosine 5'-phosphosulfate sulfotransferase (PAPS reductase)/FAD synthetase